MTSKSNFMKPVILITVLSAIMLLPNRLVSQTLPNQPNIVFILADDLGWTDLSCYGNKFNETPNIDKLAESGIRFTQAYSACPVCSPTRASIMTGKYPARLQLTNYIKGERTDENSLVLPANWNPYLESSETTLPELLKTKGYKTGMVGKWHLGNQEGQNPWEQGFDFSRMIGKNGLDYYNYSIPFISIRTKTSLPITEQIILLINSQNTEWSLFSKTGRSRFFFTWPTRRRTFLLFRVATS